MGGCSNLHVAWPSPDELQLVSQRNEERRCYFACKRMLDFSVAAILLVALSPLMLLITILVKLDSPGPALFRQPRVGLKRMVKGKQAKWQLMVFNFYKFRSMVDRADPKVHEKFTRALLSKDQETVEEMLGGKTRLKKLVQDDRITRIGKILRKSSLDELPQLWNVLKGDMSLVGPRPPTIYEAEMYTWQQAQRMGATPGMTGLWQVQGRNVADYLEMIQLDLEYIQRQSFWLDFKILALTPIAVLKTRSAA